MQKERKHEVHNAIDQKEIAKVLTKYNWINIMQYKQWIPTIKKYKSSSKTGLSTNKNRNEDRDCARIAIEIKIMKNNYQKKVLLKYNDDSIRNSKAN